MIKLLNLEMVCAKPLLIAVMCYEILRPQRANGGQQDDGQTVLDHRDSFFDECQYDDVCVREGGDM